MINRDRLLEEFVRLVRIDSPSRREGAVAGYLRERFSSMGAQVLEDGAAEFVKGESGNLIVRVPGTRKGLSPLMFNAHLDTVDPGVGINVLREGGILRSDGRTILGADDKSGIAVLIEALLALQEDGVVHAPLEFVFTICEEIGLFGAKYLNYGLVTAKMGYALDTSSTTSIISGAPEANSLQVTIQGLAAHAGLEPQSGISAIQIAGEALSAMHLGRIDSETTANIGLIRGGTARNIIPDRVELEGEVRSHDREKLALHTAHITDCFNAAVSKAGEKRGADDGLPAVRIDVTLDYPLMRIGDDHPVVSLVQEAGRSLGRGLLPQKSGGGSDANIFNAHGIATVILGTGMQRVHTTEEYIDVDDMVRTAELVVKVVSLYGL